MAKKTKNCVNTICKCFIYFFICSPLAMAVEFGPGSKKVPQDLPQKDSPSSQEEAYAQLYTGPKLDLVIPVLDPGIPSDPLKWESKGIWPELRKAESVWYAKKLANALSRLGIFNSVLVVPDTSVSADLYLMGTLKESNGEDLQVDLKLYSTTGEALLKKVKLKARVSPTWYLDESTAQQDPFNKSYTTVARKIADALIKLDKKDQKRRKKNQKYIDKGKFKKVKVEKLEEIRIVRHALYGKSLSEAEFSDAIKEKRGIQKLNYIPDLEQGSWLRVSSIVATDSKFNTMMDSSYSALCSSMSDSYRTWQKDAYTIAKAEREAKAKANAAAFGALLGAAVAGTLAKNSGSTAGKVAAATAAVASIGALTKVFKENAESKQQAAQLDELGKSVSGVLAPQVIAMQGREIELTGSASEQQAQWSTLLKELYSEGMQDFNDVEIISNS